MYIARDLDNKLFLYSEKPHKGETQWYSELGMYEELTEENSIISSDISVNWEDTEPIEVKVIINKISNG